MVAWLFTLLAGLSSPAYAEPTRSPGILEDPSPVPTGENVTYYDFLKEGLEVSQTTPQEAAEPTTEEEAMDPLPSQF